VLRIVHPAWRRASWLRSSMRLLTRSPNRACITSRCLGSPSGFGAQFAQGTHWENMKP
jgi:hypothetical protein